MTTSEVKAFLRRYRDINAKINAKLREIDRLRSAAKRATPSQGAGGNNGVSDRVGNIAAKIADIDAEINTDIDDLYRVWDEIKKAISKLPAKKYYRCIILRYIYGLKFSEIAAIMNYTTRQVYNIHGAALRILCRILSKSRR